MYNKNLLVNHTIQDSVTWQEIWLQVSNIQYFVCDDMFYMSNKHYN